MTANLGVFHSSLRQRVPEFFDSRRYKSLENLGKDLVHVPGLLLAAFTSYMCHLIEAGHSEDRNVKVGFELIEEWSQSADPVIQNYVITEIFENIRLPKYGEQYFKQRLGIAGRNLYEEWLEYPPEDRLNSKVDESDSGPY